MTLTRRVRPRRRRVVTALMMLLVASWGTALGVHVLTGSPLWDTGIELGSTELSGSTLAGVVVGAIAGVVVVVVLSIYTRRRTERLDDDE